MEPTTAQVTDPAVQPTEVAAPDTSGFQARIDALTAQTREAQKTAQEAVQKMMEMATLATANRAPAPAPMVDPLDAVRGEMDPRLVAVIEADRKRFAAALQEKTVQLEVAQGKFAIQQQVASVPGLSPEVAQRAQQLYEQARLNGSQASADEALRFAIGDEVIRQRQRAGGVAGLPTSVFNAPNATLPPVATPTVNPGYTLPANIDSLPPDQQIAAYEKAGFGDMPL